MRNGSSESPTEPPDLETVIAHEVAHAWLGYDDDDLAYSWEEAEVRAQVREWGFKGVGADEP